MLSQQFLLSTNQANHPNHGDLKAAPPRLMKPTLRSSYGSTILPLIIDWRTNRINYRAWKHCIQLVLPKQSGTKRTTRSSRPQAQMSINPRPDTPDTPQLSTATCIGSTQPFTRHPTVQGATCPPTRQPTCSTVHQTQQSLRLGSSGRTLQRRPSSWVSRPTWVWTWTTTTSVRSMATTTLDLFNIWNITSRRQSQKRGMGRMIRSWPVSLSPFRSLSPSLSTPFSSGILGLWYKTLCCFSSNQQLGPNHQPYASIVIMPTQYHRLLRKYCFYRRLIFFLRLACIYTIIK